MMNRAVSLRSPGPLRDARHCHTRAGPATWTRVVTGADDRDRTGDLVLTKDVLCQLSYIGLRPSTFALRASADKSARPFPTICQSRSDGGCQPKLACERRLERETGIEPATNSLEGCDSTTELLPPTRSRARSSRFGGPVYRKALTAFLIGARRAYVPDQPTFVSSPSRPMAATARRRAQRDLPPENSAHQLLPRVSTSHRDAVGSWWGGEGSNLRSPKAAGLQPAAIDRSATSPKTLHIARSPSVPSLAPRREASSLNPVMFV